ncbi:hypothetical protein HN748_04715, partial [Candidatus Peregrinibacteria bacterium]|nr:hypothetical protein [Candidatus Peregrinibacteria bacterium]
SEKKKKALLKVLPTFSEKQLKNLQSALLEYEKKAEPLLKEALQGERGEDYLAELKKTYKDLKRKTYKQLEKEDSSKRDPDKEFQKLLNNF